MVLVLGTPRSYTPLSRVRSPVGLPCPRSVEDTRRLPEPEDAGSIPVEGAQGRSSTPSGVSGTGTEGERSALSPNIPRYSRRVARL